MLCPAAGRHRATPGDEQVSYQPVEEAGNSPGDPGHLSKSVLERTELGLGEWGRPGEVGCLWVGPCIRGEADL